MHLCLPVHMRSGVRLLREEKEETKNFEKVKNVL